MNKSGKITDAEWKVMEIIWKNESITSSNIVKKLTTPTGWNPKTIHTLISRLVKKEVVGVKVGKVNEYYPLIYADECKIEVTDNFIKKVYNGSLELLVSNFVKSKKLSNSEIEDLIKILDEELD